MQIIRLLLLLVFKLLTMCFYILYRVLDTPLFVTLWLI